MSQTVNNKRIAKNTLFLYFRMLIMMFISFFTTRVVLRTLGVEDFGIENVVGGLISAVSFITNSLASTSSRFITYNLGKGDKEIIKKTFGNILYIHLILSVLVILVGETIGIWFLKTQLVIPESRQIAAFWLYQMSIVTAVLNIISVPYNATIIAHERMSAFAFISIFDAVAKLLFVYLLIIVPYDKLIMYSFFFMLIGIIDRIIYGVYCYRNFEETRGKIAIDRTEFKSILVYSGWTMNGHLAVFGYTQGLNILLNIFFGPLVNAARGIAVKVQIAVEQFCVNFQTAASPQITKNFAQDNLDEMHKLIVRTSKFSFFIFFLLTLPIFLEAETILCVWLEEVPENTVIFLRLTLLIGLIAPLKNPINTAIHATGDIKKFQIIEGSLLLLVVPLSYLFLKYFQIKPEFVFVIQLLVMLVTHYIRILIVLPKISMKRDVYYNTVIKPVILVLLLSPILPSVLHFFNNTSVLRLSIVTTFTFITVPFLMYKIGCTDNEKAFIASQIKKFFKLKIQ